MPEAAIASAVRSPIGRAMKGSLKSVRPDDLVVQMVAAALAKVPELDPTKIDALLLGWGQRTGQSGFNIARVVAVQPPNAVRAKDLVPLGLDNITWR